MIDAGKCDDEMPELHRNAPVGRYNGVICRWLIFSRTQRYKFKELFPGAAVLHDVINGLYTGIPLCCIWYWITTPRGKKLRPCRYHHAFNTCPSCRKKWGCVAFTEEEMKPRYSIVVNGEMRRVSEEEWLTVELKP
jgi:hypothetical protein